MNTKTIITYAALALFVGFLFYAAKHWEGTALDKLNQAQYNNSEPTQITASDNQIPMNTSGLKIEDIVVGTGEEAKSGDTITVNYTGALSNGKQFDSSVGKQPFVFNLGAGSVIKGWDLGVAGMKVGGKRKLTIPPELGYGAQDVGNGLIPPNSTLIFEVELLKVEHK